MNDLEEFKIKKRLSESIQDYVKICGGEIKNDCEDIEKIICDLICAVRANEKSIIINWIRDEGHKAWKNCKLEKHAAMSDVAWQLHDGAHRKNNSEE